MCRESAASLSGTGPHMRSAGVRRRAHAWAGRMVSTSYGYRGLWRVWRRRDAMPATDRRATLPLEQNLIKLFACSIESNSNALKAFNLFSCHAILQASIKDLDSFDIELCDILTEVHL